MGLPPPPAFLWTARSLLAGRIPLSIHIEDGAWVPGLPDYYLPFAMKGIPPRTIPSADVRENSPLFQKLDAIAFPGGWTPGYTSSLGEEGAANIRQMLARGGRYFGICAGGYYALENVDWNGRYPPGRWHYGTNIFPGDGGAIAAIIPSFTNWEIIPIDIDLTPLGVPFKGTDWILYWGGPYFIPKEDSWASREGLAPASEVMVIGRYQPDPEGVQHPAIVAYRYGEGRVVLSGPHPEMSRNYTTLWVLLDWLFA